MKYKLVDNGKRNQTIIKVVGVGGCGGNAIDHMVANGVEGVETISANTDSQALTKNKAAENMPCENSPVIVGAEEASPHPYVSF